MNILILGAAGMIGRKLLDRLAGNPVLGGEAITGAVLHDVVEAVPPAGLPFATEVLTGDYAAPGVAEPLFAAPPMVIFPHASKV
jgi:nucleoside-diphosphate-sugar epimerase